MQRLEGRRGLSAKVETREAWSQCQGRGGFLNATAAALGQLRSL